MVNLSFPNRPVPSPSICHLPDTKLTSQFFGTELYASWVRQAEFRAIPNKVQCVLNYTLVLTGITYNVWPLLILVEMGCRDHWCLWTLLC